MKQISFMYEGNRYFTAFNCSDFVDRLLKQRKSNVLTMVDMGQTAVTRRYAACNDNVDFGMMPIAEFDKVIEDDGMFIGSGTFEWEGVTYKFNLTETEVTIATEDNEAFSDTAEETEVEIPVEEIVEAEAEEETVVTEETPAPEEEEVQPEMPEEINVKPTPEPVVQEKQYRSALDPSRKSTSRGCVFGTRTTSAPSLDLKAGEKYKTVGCVFGSEFTSRKTLEKQMRKKMRAQNNIPVQSKTLKVSPDVQASIPKKQTINASAHQVPEWALRVPAIEPEQEATSITKTQPMPMPEVKDVKPQRVADTMTQKAVDCDMKAKARANMSADVAAIIGDIPLELLGNIPEYRNDPISVSEIQSGGEAFCKAASWHRAGNWYGIDVVSTLSRFICNFRREVFINIPIQNCKEWLDAVKEKKNA